MSRKTVKQASLKSQLLIKLRQLKYNQAYDLLSIIILVCLFLTLLIIDISTSDTDKYDNPFLPVKVEVVKSIDVTSANGLTVSTEDSKGYVPVYIDVAGTTNNYTYSLKGKDLARVALEDKSIVEDHGLTFHENSDYWCTYKDGSNKLFICKNTENILTNKCLVLREAKFVPTVIN